jgi:hypothetical protein
MSIREPLRPGRNPLLPVDVVFISTGPTEQGIGSIIVALMLSGKALCRRTIGHGQG